MPLPPPDMGDKHECPYPGCHRQVNANMLACRNHWFTVSKPTRDRVWDAWVQRSNDHLAAITQAIEEMRTHARNRGWNPEGTHAHRH